MVRGEAGPRLFDALASFCSALANNSLSSDCMKLLTTARLVAVAKTSGGVRPVAVGETLRRLAASCVNIRQKVQGEQTRLEVKNRQ